MSNPARQFSLILFLLTAIGIGIVWWLTRAKPQPVARAQPPATAQIGESHAAAESPSAVVDESRLVDAPIRVNLTPSPVSRLRIRIDKPYRVLLPHSQRETIHLSRLTETDVTGTSDGIQFGEGRLEGDTFEIIPQQSPAVWVNDHQYRGTIRLHRTDDGRLIAVNELPLHEYLASVVDSEMPAAFPEEARRAQAIVSRTYALYQMSNRHPQFDLFASTRSQKYLGFQYRTKNGRRLAGESRGSREIVRSTAGEVCTRDGKLIPAYYSAVCGGRTTDGGDVFRDAEELASVRCEHCRDAALYRWRAEVGREDAAESLRSYFVRNGKPFGSVSSIGIAPPPEGTSAPHYYVSDGEQKYRIAAAALRRDVFGEELHSPRFRVRLTRDRLEFEGRGSGHGVGFCQWGARGLALTGKRAHEIVLHYYPGTRVTLLARTRVAEGGEGRLRQ